MLVRVVDNTRESTADIVSRLTERSQDIRIAVAFASRDGLVLLSKAIDAALAAGAHLEFLVGLDLASTEPDALRIMYDWSQANGNAALCCHASVTRGAIYHPKMYIFETQDTVAGVIGSSNLTNGGLRRNMEANLLLECTPRDEVASDIYEAYSRLKFRPGTVVPDAEFLALYAALFEREDAGRRLARGTASVAHLRRALVEKARALGPLPATRRDLVGWLRLVYDSLPEGSFSTSALYANEETYRRHYPHNLNIRPKIRQQLQVLRDMGLISHVGRARWRRP